MFDCRQARHVKNKRGFILRRIHMRGRRVEVRIDPLPDYAQLVRRDGKAGRDRCHRAPGTSPSPVAIAASPGDARTTSTCGMPRAFKNGPASAANKRHHMCEADVIAMRRQQPRPDGDRTAPGVSPCSNHVRARQKNTRTLAGRSTAPRYMVITSIDSQCCANSRIQTLPNPRTGSASSVARLKSSRRKNDPPQPYAYMSNVERVSTDIDKKNKVGNCSVKRKVFPDDPAGRLHMRLPTLRAKLSISDNPPRRLPVQRPCPFPISCFQRRAW